VDEVDFLKQIVDPLPPPGGQQILIRWEDKPSKYFGEINAVDESILE
jgi:hypothetical protein